MTGKQHAVKIEEDKCIGCVACIMACPTKAMRVRNGKAVILDEWCIDCGECFRVCPHGSIIPLTTPTAVLKKYKVTIALPSPVLYSQFGRHTMPNDIMLALKKIGFTHVCDKAWLCEIATAVIDEHLEARPGPRPLISSRCPAVVRLITMIYPSLCPLIIPIDAPREVAARQYKQQKMKEHDLSADDIGVIDITPCPAKVISMNRLLGINKSNLDGIVSIRDIYGPVLSALKSRDEDTIIQQSSGVGIGWAINGGEINGLKTDNTLAVAGVRDVMRILDDVESGKLRGIDYLECQICPEGCVGGPLTVENRHTAKGKTVSLVKMFGEKTRVNREMVKQQHKEGFFSLSKEFVPMPAPPLDRIPAKAIEKLGKCRKIAAMLPGKDCGACGAPSCKTLAEDIVLGCASLSDCIFVRLKELTQDAGLKGFLENTGR